MNIGKVYVVVVAAGSGARFGSRLPKQFCQLDGRPVLMTAIERVRTALPASEILLVLNDGFIDYWADECSKYRFDSPVVVKGGATRWESVRNALACVPCDDDAVVMVHDGARPLLARNVTERLLEALASGHDGAIPVIDVTDSLRCVGADGSSHIVDRSRYRGVQTPQAFPARLLRQAYDKDYSPVMTDDASVMELAGYSDIVLVPGCEATMKITRPHDIDVVRLLMERQ